MIVVAELVMGSSTLYSFVLRVQAWSFVFSFACAKFSNVHFEFLEGINFLHINYPNETKVLTLFTMEVADRIQNEMLYGPNNESIVCQPFSGTLVKTVNKTTEKIGFECRDGYIGHFGTVRAASPVSINRVDYPIFNFSALYSFSRFEMVYKDVVLKFENGKTVRTTASMILSDESYLRLNISWDATTVRGSQLLDISMPHYCVKSNEMGGINDSERYLVLKIRHHLRHHFDTVEKPRLFDVLYKFIKFVVGNTWVGETALFPRFH